MKEETLRTLGAHLQRLRLARGLSLSQLASAAGMAKSNLSRLEQGSGNPTLDTIWRLAVQLGVPFGALIAPVDEALGDDDVQLTLIEQGQGTPQVDAYWMGFAPHTERQAEGHTPNTVETLFVISGHIEAGEHGALRWLAPGDSARFNADRPHFYRTQHERATLLVTITYH